MVVPLADRNALHCGLRNNIKGFTMAKSKPSTPMTPEAAARIQSNEAKANSGKVESGGFAARAQAAAAKNSNNNSE